MRDWTATIPFRRILFWLGAAAGLGCSSDDGATEPNTLTLGILPTSLTITQGGSSIITATMLRGGDASSPLNIVVYGLPEGVNSVLSDLQTEGRVTTATITVSADGNVPPGTYDPYVLGSIPGYTARANFRLTVTWPPLSCPSPGVFCEEWAIDAVASTEWSSTDWSALRAAGPPDVFSCSSDPNAWASSEPGTTDWLELTFRDALRPTEIQIHETFGVSSIVEVEVKEPTGAYHTVYTAEAQNQTCPRFLIIPVTGVTAAVNAVRVTLNQAWLNDWSEIDAVKLVGTR